jgi:PncC family amidohydrolase
LTGAHAQLGEVATALVARGLTLGTAESCTGGLIAHLITTAAGASTYYRGGVVAYDNGIKQTLLAVPAELLAQHGAVSTPVATAMAAGIRTALNCDIGVATTGIAGPGGGSPAKPVGTVCIAACSATTAHVDTYHFDGDRATIQRAAAAAALRCVLMLVSTPPSSLQ